MTLKNLKNEINNFIKTQKIKYKPISEQKVYIMDEYGIPTEIQTIKLSHNPILNKDIIIIK